MNNPQLLKRIGITALAFAVLGSSQSFAASGNTTLAVPMMKITSKSLKLTDAAKTLIKITSMIQKYATSVVLSNGAKISDATLRMQYTDEINAVIARLSAQSAKISTTTDINASEVKKDLKEIFFSLKAINKEILSLKKDASPYTVSTGSTKEIEDIMISAQKDMTKQLREYINKYKSGATETGNLKFSFSAPQGKVSMNIEKYVSLYNLLTDAQDMDMKMTIDFSFAANSVTSTGAIAGTIVVDGNMKIVDKVLYLQLRDYSVSMQNATADIIAMVDGLKAQLDIYKGKSVFVKMPEGAGNSNGLKALNDILDILDTQSLLMVKKEIAGTYFLSLKKSTIEALQNATGEKRNASFDSTYNTIVGKMTKSGNDFVLTFGEYPRFSVRDAVATLSRAAGVYTFKFDIQNGEKTASFLAQKDYLTLSAQGKDWSVAAKWQSDYLSIQTISSAGKVDISGKYSTKESDLSVKWNGENIGYIKGKEEATNQYSWDINVLLPAPLSYGFQYTGKMLLEFGEVKIVAPTGAVDANSLQQK